MLVDKLVVKLVGVQVVQPYPLDAVYLRKLAAQAGKTALAVDIRAVAGDVLRDDDKLLDPVLAQAPVASSMMFSIGGLSGSGRGCTGIAQKAQKLLQPSAMRRYAQPGPVETTRGISSTAALLLPNRLSLRPVADGVRRPRRYRRSCQRLARRRSPAARSVSMSLYRSARQPVTIMAAELSGLFQLGHLENVVDGLGSWRLSMKPQVLTIARSAPIRLGDKLVARLAHKVQHLLAVDKILGAAKRDHCDMYSSEILVLLT